MSWPTSQPVYFKIDYKELRGASSRFETMERIIGVARGAVGAPAPPRAVKKNIFQA